jgi:hypothetical protein
MAKIDHLGITVRSIEHTVLKNEEDDERVRSVIQDPISAV